MITRRQLLLLPTAAFADRLRAQTDVWVSALINSGATDEAMATVEGLPTAADLSDNPQYKVLALT